MTAPKVIYEDSYLCALNKPANIHSTNLPNDNQKPSIANFISKYCPSAIYSSDKPEDCGLVNRLDFETSGILIFAKDKKVWGDLRAAFSETEVDKIYFAILEGKMKSGVQCENYIGSTSRTAKKVKIFDKEVDRSLKAISNFRLFQYYPDLEISAAEISISTGRRHQIRAHAAHIGHPLLGDTLYGAKKKIKDLFPENHENIFFLHSWKYSLEHPKTGEVINLIAPLEDLSWFRLF